MGLQFSFIFLKGLLFLLRQRVGGCGCGPPASLFDCATVCLSASLTCSLPTGVEEFRAFVSPAKKLPTSAAGLAFAGCAWQRSSRPVATPAELLSSAAGFEFLRHFGARKRLPKVWK